MFTPLVKLGLNGSSIYIDDAALVNEIQSQSVITSNCSKSVNEFSSKLQDLTLKVDNVAQGHNDGDVLGELKEIKDKCNEMDNQIKILVDSVSNQQQIINDLVNKTKGYDDIKSLVDKLCERIELSEQSILELKKIQPPNQFSRQAPNPQQQYPQYQHPQQQYPQQHPQQQYPQNPQQPQIIPISNQIPHPSPYNIYTPINSQPFQIPPPIQKPQQPQIPFAPQPQIPLAPQPQDEEQIKDKVEAKETTTEPKNEEKTIAECPVCGEKMEISKIDIHLDRVHCRPQFECPVCFNDCQNENNLNRHMAYYHRELLN
ncbi:hypothetical protein QTN25_002024 [Entamoeba marina]